MAVGGGALGVGGFLFGGSRFALGCIAFLAGRRQGLRAGTGTAPPH